MWPPSCVQRLWLLLLLGSYAAVHDVTANDEQDIRRLSSRGKRLMPSIEDYLWPKAVIPYKIQPGVLNRTEEYLKAMAFVEDNSCIRYVPYNLSTSREMELGHQNYLDFVKAVGCWARVLGSISKGKGRKISCCTGGACVHELGHALGMYHEQLNPKGEGWARINSQSIWPKNRGSYRRLDSTKNLVQTFPYDISSIMHYGIYGGNGLGDSMTMLFPELKRGKEYHHFFMEVASSYKCGDKEACKDFGLTCVNDGYKTIVHGKCACRCIPGLDPSTGCSTVLKKDGATTTWPRGQYALPMPTTGCPDGAFNSGQMTLRGKDGKSIAKASFCARTLDDDVFENEKMEMFNWPLGEYCVYKWGAKCPGGFLPASIGYGDGSSDSILADLCCQYKGLDFKGVSFPTNKPFSLFRLDGRCQVIHGMRAQSDRISIHSNDAKIKFRVDGRVGHSLQDRDRTLFLHLCHYKPVDSDCGDVITLDKAKPVTRVKYSSVGRGDLECTWLVKGEHQNGTLVLDFEKFDTKGDDKVEVRHALMGQKGLSYSGKKIDHSVRTITSMTMVRFFTYSGAFESSFEVKIRWIPNEDLCYDVNDRGASYSGKVNYTRLFEPCLPWAHVTQCPHHPFQNGDELANLEENYCRNPDNSFRPWCYTDTTRCKRNYCDVCHLETPYDKSDSCKMFKDEGFCKKEAATAIQHCTKTCFDQLLENISDSSAKYTEVECNTPTFLPSAETNTKYKLGESVSLTCKRTGNPRAENATGNDKTAPSLCLTNGQWSPMFPLCSNCIVVGASDSKIKYSCYEFHDKLVNFEQARAECKKGNGYLASPKNLRENDLVASIGHGKTFFLGASDTDTEGNFVWEDGTTMEWSNWGTKQQLGVDQPDDYKSGEDCVSMTRYGTWNDVPCTIRYRFVCEYPGEDIECKDFLKHQCPQLLSNRPSMCKEFPLFALSFCAETCGLCIANRSDCKVLPTNMDVTVSTSNATIPVGDYVTYSCNDKFKYRTTGEATRACQTNGQLTGEEVKCSGCPYGYVFVNGSCYGRLEGRSLTFQEAKENCREIGGMVPTPKNKDKNDLISSVVQRGTVWIDDAQSSLVGQEECTFLYGSDSKFNNSCYKYVDKLVTFSQAHSECLKLNGFVASPKILAEHNFIASIRNGETVFLGAMDTDKEGDFVWEDGTPMDWNNWGPNQPDDYKSGEDCLSMMSNGNWNDVPCDIQYRFVCEIPDTFHMEWQNWDNESTVDCISIYGSESTFNGSCYEFVDELVSFSQARNYCGKQNGHLASAKNPAENDFVDWIRNGNTVFLGASDEDKEGTFVWEDGTKMEWNKWDSNLPDNYRNGEDCASMKLNGMWNDVPCSIKYRFVCQYPEVLVKPNRPDGKGCTAMTKSKKWIKEKCDSTKPWTVCAIPTLGSNMCYDLKNKGLYYNGRVSYTVDFKPCRHWSEVTECDYHVFKEGMEKYNLEGNYCRNPGDGERPWCYYAGCSRQYCDVCASDDTQDVAHDCQNKRDAGFCTADTIRAAAWCAHTCKDLLPSSAKNYVEVVCDAPVAPPDGVIVSPTKSHYQLGDVVTYKCKRNKFVVNSTCLTSGDWSPVGVACTECPVGYVEFNNTCHGVIGEIALSAIEAENECEKIGGHLPMPKTTSENAFLGRLVKGKSKWIGSRLSSENGCLYSESDGQWTNTLCDFRATNLRTICSVTKFEDVTCADYLPLQCPTLLKDKPAMCKNFPEFSRTMCAKTCVICETKNGV